MQIDKIPDVLGYLILTEDGAVQTSSGELQNNENTANILMNFIRLTESVDPAIFPSSSVNKISIIYEEFSYVICLSNKQYYIVKKRIPNSENSAPQA